MWQKELKTLIPWRTAALYWHRLALDTLAKESEKTEATVPFTYSAFWKKASDQSSIVDSRVSQGDKQLNPLQWNELGISGNLVLLE